MQLNIGENIRSFRKKRNLTQEQLAEAVGVTVGAVSKWETNQSSPDINMIVLLAEFFETSIDVLLGYQLQTTHIKEAKERIKNFYQTKKYESGKLEVQKSLLKYPNCFDIVYESARFYSLHGMEQKNKEDLTYSLTLYQRTLSLIDQNTDETINEFTIQNEIGFVYATLGDLPTAISHMKKYNYDGINNSKIGLLLANNGSYDEALPFLSESLLTHSMELFRTAVGLINCYDNTKKHDLALEVIDWIQDFIHSLKKNESISFLDKLEVMLITARTLIYGESKEYQEAKDSLRKAMILAKQYDQAPDYNANKTRFYHGKDESIYDDFGETATAGVLRAIQDNESCKDILMKMWEEINNEDRID